MKDWKSQSHVEWECKYHVVILPKYRKKVLYGKDRRRIGEILRDLCGQKGVDFEEGKFMPKHIHMLIGVHPKYSLKSLFFSFSMSHSNMACSKALLTEPVSGCRHTMKHIILKAASGDHDM